MPDLRQTRKKVKITLGAMALVDIAAVALYFSPLIGTEATRRAQLGDLWRELQQKTREVAPLNGLDKKIPAARLQIAQFYKDRLPGADSAIPESIGKIAAEAGVQPGTIKYDMKDPETLGLQRVLIEADLSGGYLQLVRFINALERSPQFFIVDSVTLGGEQNGIVKLQLKMETYLKTGTA
jgi:Tfp pilus assembly protein PilO